MGSISLLCAVVGAKHSNALLVEEFLPIYFHRGTAILLRKQCLLVVLLLRQRLVGEQQASPHLAQRFRRICA